MHSYFKFDSEWTLVPYNYWIFPKFEKKILYEDDKYIEYIDTNGIKQREYKDKSSMPMFLEFHLLLLSSNPNGDLGREILSLVTIKELLIPNTDTIQS